MNLVFHVAGLMALLQLLDDVGIARGGKESRQPIMMLPNLVGHRVGFDRPGPADHLRYPERALPVGGLLTSERGRSAVGPAVGMRTVIGAVDDDGVLGNAEFVDQIEQLTYVAVVV